MTREKLSSLSDKRLLSRTQKLVDAERRITVSVLSHLNEIERRRLHLKLGYGSLFDYCVEHLGYSPPAAGRRIQSARCVRDFPQAHGMLERNELNLTTLSIVAGIMNKDNYSEILLRIRNKSKREVETIKAAYTGPVVLHDRMRSVRVSVPEKAVVPDEDYIPTLAGESKSAVKSYRGGVEEPVTPVDTRPRMTVQKRIAVQFTATPGFIEKFEEVRGLLMHRFAGQPSYEQVFDAVLDFFLDRYSPDRRRKRRQDVASKNTNEKPEAAGRNSKIHSRRRECGKRQPIPAAVRDEVHARSGGRCEYVGAGGRRCNSTACVQVDHVVPVCRGGTNKPSNLRLLCAAHNRLEAERVLGDSGTVRGGPW